MSAKSSSSSTTPSSSSGRRKVALITGITGQDGSYLTELLLSKGYTVHGIVRRSCYNTGQIDHLYRNRAETGIPLHLHTGDLCDGPSIIRIIAAVKPTEVYNLGAVSSVKASFDTPEYTAHCDGLGVLRILDAIRLSGLEKQVRFYQASSSELYGKAKEVPQTEETPFYPRSPYAVAKQYAYWILINYREAYGMYLTNGILFNHESPRRGRIFVTRKITSSVANIAEGKQQCLYLGNLDAKRDWGHSRDFVEGMWLMLQQEKPDDFVLATGECHTVREFVENAFAVVNITIKWRGRQGTVEEVGYDANDPDERVLVRVDPKFFRPTEAMDILGNPQKAKEKMGWIPKTKFADLAKEMVEADLKLVRGEREDNKQD